MLDKQDGTVPKLVVNRGRIAEEEQVRIQIGQHINRPMLFQQVDEEGGAAGPVVLDRLPARLRRQECGVSLLQLGQPDQLDLLEPQVRERVVRLLVEAQDPEHERRAVPRQRPVQGQAAGQVMSVEVRRVVQRSTVWDGFSRFCCNELGLAPETVLRAHFAPLLNRLERQRETLEGVEPNQAKVEEYANLLTTGWRRRLGIETSEP